MPNYKVKCESSDESCTNVYFHDEVIQNLDVSEVENQKLIMLKLSKAIAAKSLPGLNTVHVLSVVRDDEIVGMTHKLSIVLNGDVSTTLSVNIHAHDFISQQVLIEKARECVIQVSDREMKNENNNIHPAVFDHAQKIAKAAEDSEFVKVESKEVKEAMERDEEGDYVKADLSQSFFDVGDSFIAIEKSLEAKEYKKPARDPRAPLLDLGEGGDIDEYDINDFYTGIVNAKLAILKEYHGEKVKIFSLLDGAETKEWMRKLKANITDEKPKDGYDQLALLAYYFLSKLERLPVKLIRCIVPVKFPNKEEDIKKYVVTLARWSFKQYAPFRKVKAKDAVAAKDVKSETPQVKKEEEVKESKILDSEYDMCEVPYTPAEIECGRAPLPPRDEVESKLPASPSVMDSMMRSSYFFPPYGGPETSNEPTPVRSTLLPPQAIDSVPPPPPATLLEKVEDGANHVVSFAKGVYERFTEEKTAPPKNTGHPTGYIPPSDDRVKADALITSGQEVAGAHAASKAFHVVVDAVGHAASGAINALDRHLHITSQATPAPSSVPPVVALSTRPLEIKTVDRDARKAEVLIKRILLETLFWHDQVRFGGGVSLARGGASVPTGIANLRKELKSKSPINLDTMADIANKSLEKKSTFYCLFDQPIRRKKETTAFYKAIADYKTHKNSEKLVAELKGCKKTLDTWKKDHSPHTQKIEAKKDLAVPLLTKKRG